MEFSIYDREYCCCEMTQPTSEEIGYSSYCYVPLSVSEDTDYHYDGNTGTLLSGGVPIKEYAMGGKMNQLELYGNYYKMFKGNGGMPEKVTVIDIEGDIVTFVSGHHSKEEFAERGNTVNEAIYNMCLVKNNCNSNKILTKITPKQKQRIDEEDKKIQKAIDEADRVLEKFKNGGMNQ